MRLHRIDPPGTWLQFAAVFDMLARHAAGRRFLDVGCGEGSLSRQLLRRGFTGTGLDASPDAVARATENLRREVDRGLYEIRAGSVEELASGDPFDFAVSMMVVEHVHDQGRFVMSLARQVRPGGIVLLAVPGRNDHWSCEDETVGHLRRYEKSDLAALLAEAGLDVLDVWSVAVPVANLLFHLGNRMVARSDVELGKRHLGKWEQTLTSGTRDVPFKTVFPAPFKLILNRWTMMPLAWLQRLFYRSSRGITLIGAGRVPLAGTESGATRPHRQSTRSGQEVRAPVVESQE